MVESNTLNKYIKTIQNFIKNLIIEVKTLHSPTETWERKCGFWERRNELESLEFKVRAEVRACWKTPPRADNSLRSHHKSLSDATPHANQPLKHMMTAQRPVTHSDRPDTKQLWGHYFLFQTHSQRGSGKKMEKTTSSGWFGSVC